MFREDFNNIFENDTEMPKKVSVGEIVFGSPGNPVIDLDIASSSNYIKREEPEPLIDSLKSDEKEPELVKEKKGCCPCLFSFKFKKSVKEVDETLGNKEDIRKAPGV